MQGIDEEFALLQTVRAGLSVKQKKITANSFEETVADLKAAVKAKYVSLMAAQYSGLNFATV